jgi:hypothetical protein
MTPQEFAANYSGAVFYRDGGKRVTKNSGWLLRHADEVSHLVIRTTLAGTPLPGAWLIAYAKPNAGWESWSEAWVTPHDSPSVVEWLQARKGLKGLTVFLDPSRDENASNRYTLKGAFIQL